MKKLLALSRRRTLQALGLGSLTALLTSSRRGTAGAKAPRLVLCTFTNGVTDPALFWPPTGSLTTLAAGHTLQPLADENLLGRTTVLAGLDHPAAAASGLAGHEALFTLFSGTKMDSGGAGGPTFDRVIAEALARQFGSLPYDVLNLGIFSSDWQVNTLSWRGIQQPAPSEPDPRRVFQQLFQGSQASNLRERAQQSDILALASDDIARLRGAFRGDDRLLLDQHVDSLARLTETLKPEHLADPACYASLSLPSAPDTVGYYSDPGAFSARLTQVADLQGELLTMAMKCGLTRVATFQLGDAAGEWHDVTTDNTIGVPVTAKRNVHYGLAHSGETEGRLAKIALETAYVRSLARLIARFRDTPDADGASLLDSTIFVFINSFHNGQSHALAPLPAFVVAGSAVGAGLASGTSVDAAGQPVNALFVSVAHALGLGDIDVVGSDRFGHGPLEIKG